LYSGSVQTFLMAGANTLTYADDDVSSLFKSESQHRFDRRIAAVSDLLKEKVGAEPCGKC
jgi:hypothetical protein